ncbi:hypothetical protein CEJ63_26885, partial [Acinetobacter baumannii]
CGLGGDHAVTKTRVGDAINSHDDSVSGGNPDYRPSPAVRGVLPSWNGVSANASPIPAGFVLQCSVQSTFVHRTMALHPDVGEGAEPAGSSLQAGFFIACR